jgi:hypothetical protein
MTPGAVPPPPPGQMGREGQAAWSDEFRPRVFIGYWGTQIGGENGGLTKGARVGGGGVPPGV